MTPFRKLLNRFIEKATGEFYEGPEPPKRVEDMVVMFANDHPKATRKEWVDFATELVGEAYRIGWTRGYEATERTFDWRSDIPPEELADMIDPTWIDDGRGISLDVVNQPVPEDPETEEEILRQQTNEVFIASARRGG